LQVIDTRPPAARHNFNDLSSVDKYEMPEAQYEQLSDSVLAWKKGQKLGRFNPTAKTLSELIEERKSKDEGEIRRKGITTGSRCRIGADDTRRGVVRFVGPIEGLGGDRESGCRWIGVELDEPFGRNDGSVKVKVDGDTEEVRRVFECKNNFGVLARPEKVEVGDWPPLDDLEVDEDMEEV
jgi:tubulin-folding cofactor B